MKTNRRSDGDTHGSFHKIARRGLAVLSFTATVLVASAQAQKLNVIHYFSWPDGAYPSSAPSVDRAGNLYGTTTEGGTSGEGTVYKLSHRGSSWVMSTLYAFTGGSDGSNPFARVVFGPDGRLYGTTESGGLNSCQQGCGTVFQLTPQATFCPNVFCAWRETVLHSFTGTDGAYPQDSGDLTFDDAGNIYGTTSGGGSNGEGTAFELIPGQTGWTHTILHNFVGPPSDGSTPFSGMIFDNSGTLYGAAGNGGFYYYGNVFSLSRSGSGWIENTLYSFQNSDDGYNPVGGLVFDALGKLHGTTYVGGSGQGGTTFELTAASGNWIFSLLHSFTSNGAGGPLYTLAQDAAGNLYGTTYVGGVYGYGLLFKLAFSNGTWTYSDLYDFTGGSDGAYPFAVTVGTDGNLYGTTSQGGIGCGEFGCGVVFELTP